MTSADRELELFLRRFRPASPPPLRPPSSRRKAPWLAAMVAVAAGMAAIGLWPPPREAPPAPAEPRSASRVSLGALNAAVREGRYEAALDTIALDVLPDPRREGGALHVAGDASLDR